MEKIGYTTVKSWLEGISSSKYQWKNGSQNDIRFDDLEDLADAGLGSEGKSSRVTPIPVSSASRTIQFRQTLPFYRRPFAIAASVALVMITVFQLFNLKSTETFTADKGSNLEVELPDGSLAVLNSESSLIIDGGSFESENREVELVGEAWFEVKKGSSFSVKASNGLVKVLGTSFNVYSRDNEFEVICAEGKVLAKVGINKAILTQGEGISYDRASRKFLERNNMQKIEWRQGTFHFEEAPISKVLGELSRQYDVEVVNKAPLDLNYTGLFKKGDLETSLELVCKPLGLNYMITQRKEGNTSVTIQ